jgi:hypothetical protein
MMGETNNTEAESKPGGDTEQEEQDEWDSERKPDETDEEKTTATARGQTIYIHPSMIRFPTLSISPRNLTVCAAAGWKGTPNSPERKFNIQH